MLLDVIQSSRSRPGCSVQQKMDTPPRSHDDLRARVAFRRAEDDAAQQEPVQALLTRAADRIHPMSATLTASSTCGDANAVS